MLYPLLESANPNKIAEYYAGLESTGASILIECFKELSDDFMSITHCHTTTLCGKYHTSEMNIHIPSQNINFGLSIHTIGNKHNSYSVFVCSIESEFNVDTKEQRIRIPRNTNLIDRGKIKYKIKGLLGKLPIGPVFGEDIYTPQLILDKTIRCIESYKMVNYKYTARGRYMMLYPKHVIYANDINSSIENLEVTIILNYGTLDHIAVRSLKRNIQVEIVMTKELIKYANKNIDDMIMEQLKPILN